MRIIHLYFLDMQKILFSMFFLIFFLSASQIYAVTDSLDVTDSSQERLQERKLINEQTKVEKKTEIAARIQEKINALNQRIADKLNNHVVTLENFLSKIESRLQKIEAQGGSVTEIRNKIQTIRTKIQDLKLQIEAQKTKVYTIDITNETRLRIEAGKTYQSLQKDLRNIRTTIISVRTQIVSLLPSIARLNLKAVKDSTVSATISPSISP